MMTIYTRSQKWDNLKFILIFLVVLGHIADIYAETSAATGYLRYFIYTFHMPLFIFVSGLFSKKNIDMKRWEKLAAYPVLYIFIKVLIFAARWVSRGTKPSFELFSDAGAPWYVFCLFSFCIITMVTKNIDRKYVLIFSVILACLAGYDNSIRDTFCLSRTIVYYPFFFLGYCLDPEKVERFFESKILKIISIALISISFVIIVIFYDSIEGLKYIFTGRNPYSIVIKNCPYAFISRLICYAVSTLMGISLISLTPSKTHFGLMARWGSKSLSIYAFHYPLMTLWFGIVNKAFHIEGFFVSKLLLYEILSAVVITAICLMPFWNTLLKKITSIPFIKAKEVQQ